MKKHNFSAGPSILPQPVFEQAAQAVLNYNNSGLSILEISHRSPAFVAIMEEANQLVRDLLGIGSDYEVLFLTGGASTQFFMSALNLLGDKQTAAYIDTGSWSAKAIKEAQRYGNVEVVASSKDANYNYIPKEYAVPDGSRFLHITSNNTIFGTQYRELPDTRVPIIADMSSDIFSRPIDIERYGMIYAGAQKNLGPSGTTLVILHKEMLNQTGRSIPTMLDYNTHINKKSAFNTPPVYPIYVCMLTLRWLIDQGGVAVMEHRNEEKANLLYEEIDNNILFEGTTITQDRSRMNVTFVLKNKELEEAFLDKCERAGIVGIKGHRSVGGFRASIYNAMPRESVEVLVDLMKDFTAKNA